MQFREWLLKEDIARTQTFDRDWKGKPLPDPISYNIYKNPNTEETLATIKIDSEIKKAHLWLPSGVVGIARGILTRRGGDVFICPESFGTHTQLASELGVEARFYFNIYGHDLQSISVDAYNKDQVLPELEKYPNYQRMTGIKTTKKGTPLKSISQVTWDDIDTRMKKPQPGTFEKLPYESYYAI